ncbi:integrase [Brooklawnia cerclae]|uniref:hypothetical protein n=1 Tax=Actinomycetes TaxID=1760 RepID=UPI00211475CE|nr:hypothetical protein [Microbacterium sp. J1-1]UUE22493.1 hypothetical protein LRQ07_18390 [Microbacterium sp. J1-1]
MSIANTAASAEHPGRGPFVGLDVAKVAGLSLAPGSARPVFDYDIWDLSGLADAPVIMGAHRKILDFTQITNPRWRLTARQYLLARMVPGHPTIATLPHAIRSPLNPNSLWTALKHLAGWFNYLTAAGVHSLTEVTQAHCDSYLLALSQDAGQGGRRLSPATLTTSVRAPQMLALYDEILDEHYQDGFTPWAGRSPDVVAGYQRPYGNRVPPVPDTLLRPLLADTLYLVSTIAPLLTAEATAAATFDRREAASRRHLPAQQLDSLREAIGSRTVSGVPAPKLSAGALTQRLGRGWDPNDPLLHLAWHPVVVETVGAMGHRRDLERLRPELETWVNRCGIEQPWARNPATVAPLHGDEPVAWTAPMSRQQLDTTIYALTSACYYLTAALSGMRASELLELTAGCRRRDELPGGSSRFRLVTRRTKGESFGGVEDAWVVLADVDQAITMAEQLTGAATGQRLFATGSNNSNRRLTALRQWIGSEPGRRLGLDPVPDGAINPRALRRTLALTIAQRPHGLMAAKVHLKHVSIATTEGYAARPGGQQAAFIAEISAEEEAEHLRLTAAAYHDYQRGVLPAGHGARDLIAAFQSVDQLLARHDPGPVTVIDDRRVERLLKTTAATLHVGIGNYCWFTDPSKALCLKLAGTPDADQPLIGMCDSARCPQATHHALHRPAWAEHAQNITTVFLGNPRLSKPEQARARTALDRAQRILAEIDADGASPDQNATGANTVQEPDHGQ